MAREHLRGSDSSGRKIKVAGPDGNVRTYDTSVYIPGKRAKARMEESEKKRERAASPRAHGTSRGSATYMASEPGSLIGGIRASGIKAVKHTSGIPVVRELSEEERHKIWQPPLRDTSRFGGSSSSRHRSGSSTSYSDSAAGPGGSLADDDLSRKRIKRVKAARAVSSKKGEAGGKQGKTRKAKKTNSSPQKMFYVRSKEGKSLYYCMDIDKQWSVLALFGVRLPIDSFRITDDGVQLTVGLTSLGFDNDKQFNLFCAHAEENYNAIAEQLAEQREASHDKSGDEPSPTNACTDEERQAWAAEMVKEYYEVYGPHWDQWRRLVPWLGSTGVRNLASTLGVDELWSDKDRESFLHYEGFDWSVWEMNTLIAYYPLWPDDSPDWEIDLPGRSADERRELARLLNIPSVGQMRELARVAVGLNSTN